MMRSDKMRVDAEPEQPQAVFEIMLPYRLVPFEELFTAPYVVYEYIESALVGTDAPDKLGDLGCDEMIDLDGDAFAAERGHDLGGFLDGLGPLIFGCLPACRPPGDIDSGAGGTELGRDAAAGAPRCARDKGNFSLQIHDLPPLTETNGLPSGIVEYINDHSFINESQDAQA